MKEKVTVSKKYFAFAITVYCLWIAGLITLTVLRRHGY
jgi:hypothetical protein